MQSERLQDPFSQIQSHINLHVVQLIHQNMFIHDARDENLLHLNFNR